MPFLRYFLFVGLGLWGLLLASNYMLAPSQADVAASNAAANAPVKDALYFWREAEARKRTPAQHQFTVMPQTVPTMASAIPATQSPAIASATQVPATSATALPVKLASSDVKADAPAAVAPKAEKPKKVRRNVARAPSGSYELRQAYLQHQEWQQQQRFRQANASMTRGGPFGLFAGVW